jgi:hypothetical protein
MPFGQLKRDRINRKLQLYYLGYYEDFQVQQKKEYGPLIRNYLVETVDEILAAVEALPSILIFRADLRFPDDMPRCSMHDNNQVLTTFFRYFKEEIKRASKAYKPFFRFVWAREQDTSQKPHYHVLIMLNYNVFRSIGKMEPNEYGVYLRDNLYHRMMRCWYRAMGRFETEPHGQLIHMGEDPITGKLWTGHLRRNNWHSINQAVYNASYLCKQYSKRFGEGIRVFQTSQGGRAKKR